MAQILYTVLTIVAIVKCGSSIVENPSPEMLTGKSSSSPGDIVNWRLTNSKVGSS